MQREVFLEIKQKQRAKEMIGQDNIPPTKKNRQLKTRKKVKIPQVGV